MTSCVSAPRCPKVKRPLDSSFSGKVVNCEKSVENKLWPEQGCRSDDRKRLGVPRVGRALGSWTALAWTATGQISAGPGPEKKFLILCFSITSPIFLAVFCSFLLRFLLSTNKAANSSNRSITVWAQPASILLLNWAFKLAEGGWSSWGPTNDRVRGSTIFRFSGEIRNPFD